MRRLLFAHYTPHDNGKPMRGPIMFFSWGSESIADKLAYIQWVHDQKLPLEVYAVDAGWYGASVGAEDDPTNPWWKNRGDWFPSPLYYPNGIKPLGDALRTARFGFSLWVEPESAMQDAKIVKEHPDWFFRQLPRTSYRQWPFPYGTLLTNLGNPAAREGITEMISSLISDFGITWYRQDSNTRPEHFWELADTPDRVGMAEIRHIEGLYEMWDTLLTRYPGIHIDNCASGGRRLDIEMMARSFAVWRTDYGFKDTLAEQAQTQALAYWVPQNLGIESYTESKPWTKPGPYSTPENLYLMRLGYNVGYGVVTPGAAGVRSDAWVSWMQRAISEYREAQPYFQGDFYPLLSYSLNNDTWTAWQWNRPEHKDGLIIVLRRPQSPFPAISLRLQHLDPNAIYDVEVRTSYKKEHVKRMRGCNLVQLQIQLSNAPDSALVFYRKTARTD
jgi:alpha-galactosidase